MEGKNKIYIYTNISTLIWTFYFWTKLSKEMRIEINLHWLKKKKFSDDEVIFLGDNASCHRAKSVEVFLQENDLNKTNSLNLNLNDNYKKEHCQPAISTFFRFH